MTQDTIITGLDVAGQSKYELTAYVLVVPERQKKMDLSRPLKLHHHPMEQTHTIWVSMDRYAQCSP